MFSAGLIASFPQGPAVKLTSRFLSVRPGSSGTSQSYVMLESTGRLAVNSDFLDGAEVYIPGEYLKNQAVGAGSIYRVRASAVAGNNITLGASNVFQTLAGNRTYGWRVNGPVPEGFGGRMLVEIEHQATQVIVASALFWTTGYEP